MSKTWAPDPTYKFENERIVCACNLYPNGKVLGARHFDSCMRAQIETAREAGINYDKRDCEQGFINQWGEFLDREEAWIIAERRGQIIKKVSVDGILYSENLY